VARRVVLRPDPSDQWERLGRNDPYYGVYTVEEFHGRELDEHARERFFASGGEHIEGLLADIRGLIDSNYTPEKALEYGCGVGRLLIPLAARTRRLVGVDVSPSMLTEARRNCADFGVRQVDLVGTDAIDQLEPEFDLVHSSLVLQHVPVPEGERIFARLVLLIRPGGVGAIQVPIGATRPLLVFNRLMKLPLTHNVLNVARGRRWSYPHMQMNVYNLNRLLRILRSLRVELVHVKLGAVSGGYESCTLIFQR
jgi:SAM-dependent methyltransferase